ncbi:MAG: metal-dependent transcriptional regulator [Candidatus Limnocylindria bacterium]
MASASQSHPATTGTTDAAADYLMTIRYMHAEGQPVIAARLAERLRVSPATVSEMVTRLVRDGLLRVDEQTRQLELTEIGLGTAERTFRRHALAEWLLTAVVGLGWAEADEEAHHLQHAMSDRVTDKIDLLLGKPPTCPHGNPIPRDGRTAQRPAGEPLSEARAGEQITILRVTEQAEEDARLLTFLEQNDVRPGAMFTVTDVADHIGTMTLERDERRVTLGLVAAAKLRMLRGRADERLFHRVPDRSGRAANAAAGGATSDPAGGKAADAGSC